jgi:Transposase IS66 family
LQLLLDELDRLVGDWPPKLLPKSPLRRAKTYARNQRAFFRRCFEDGRFEIDNGASNVESGFLPSGVAILCSPAWCGVASGSRPPAPLQRG